MTLDEITRYAHQQADSAQIRLLKKAVDEDVKLYDDTYWQPVLDLIRFELNQHTGAVSR